MLSHYSFKQFISTIAEIIRRAMVATVVIISALLSLCDGGAILQTAQDTIYKAIGAVEEVEERLEPSLFEVTATVGELIKNTTSKYSWQHIQEVFGECLQDCLDQIYDEEAIKSCIYEKKENCEAMKGYDDKELIPYYTSLQAGSKITQLPGKAIGAVLGLGTSRDDEYSINKRVLNAGFKFIETTAEEKLAEEFLDNGKNKVLGFIKSLNNDLESAFYKGKDALGYMVASGKNLSETEEAEQLKNSIDDGRYVVKTALKSSKDIAKSVTSLPINSTIETSNYAINHLLDSGIKLAGSEEAVQLKTAIGDTKNAVQSLINSGMTFKESVKSIPQQIVAEISNCTTETSTLPGSISPAVEKAEQLKQELTNGKNALTTIVGSSLKLADYVAALPMKTAIDVGNFYVDSILESGLRIAKSDEAMLLNSAVFARKNTTDSVIDSGKKFVDTVIEIPRKTASDIKTIATETFLGDSKNVTFEASSIAEST